MILYICGPFLVSAALTLIVGWPIMVLVDELLVRRSGAPQRTGCSLVAAMWCPAITTAYVVSLFVLIISLRHQVLWRGPWDTLAAFAVAALLAWLTWKTAKYAAASGVRVHAVGDE